MRLLQTAGPVTIGAGEAALGVAEQLGFEQRFRKCRAVDGHVAPSRTRGASMNVLGDEILADAALPGDEDLPVARRRARRGCADVPHRRTRAHDDRVLTSWSDS